MNKLLLTLVAATCIMQGISAMQKTATTPVPKQQIVHATALNRLTIVNNQPKDAMPVFIAYTSNWSTGMQSMQGSFVHGDKTEFKLPEMVGRVQLITAKGHYEVSLRPLLEKNGQRAFSLSKYEMGPGGLENNALTEPLPQRFVHANIIIAEDGTVALVMTQNLGF